MELTLKRAYGSFFLNGAFLTPDSRLDPPAYGGGTSTFEGIGGYIDFTARSSAQQRLLTSYDATQTPETITCAVIYSGTTV